MRKREPARAADAVWLFPATYAVHLLEEYLAGGGFPQWARDAIGVRMSDAEFVAWNAFAFVLMCAGALLVSRGAKFRFIEVALAVAVLGNAAAHVTGSVATWSYSPGLISAVFLWVPLGWIRLRSAARVCSRRGRVAGTCIGVFVTILILTILATALASRAGD